MQLAVQMTLQTRPYGTRLLVACRAGLILYCIQVLTYFIPFTLVHCASINGNNPEGETDKQTKKQAEAACAEVWMQGVVWSCIACRVQYTMHQSTQKSFGDTSEVHWKSAEFNVQGHTLTSPPF